jgi:peptidyl-prolyl cis-trans isomerase C
MLPLSRLPLIPVIAFALLAASGCDRNAAPEGVITTVGPRQITAADFEHYLDRNVGAAARQIPDEATSGLLDQMIHEALISEYAARQGISFTTNELTAAVRNDPGSTIQEKTDEMRRGRLLADIAGELPQPTEAEVRAHYEQNTAEFRSEEQVRVRQLLMHDDVAAAQALAELRAGEAFEEVSRKYSKAPNAMQGGDIGLVARGQLPRDFEDAIFALSEGGISPPIRTETNFFHIFKVEQVQPAGQIPLDAARPLIEQKLREDRFRAEFDRTMERAERAVPVRVYEDRLRFNYTGRYSSR